MNPSILIIGAGISGLSAGCYGQMNGYDTQIFELHDLPGGLCTAWERKGFSFDGAIQYLFGSAPGQPFHRMWEELGAVQGRAFYHHDEMMRVIAPDGRTLIAYCDPDRLEDHLKEISPRDSELIEEFTQGIRTFKEFDLSYLMEQPRSTLNPEQWAELGLKMAPYAPAMARWGLVNTQGLGRRFKDPFLRRALPLIFAWPDIPVVVGMFLLAAMHNRNAGFPAGGSLEFARALERRYVDLGGQIHYKSQVEKILVEDSGKHRPGGRSYGLRLYNDEIYRGDQIISAADGRGTLFDLLGEQYLPQSIKNLYDGHLPIYTQIQVSLGVDRYLVGTPHWITYLLDQPVLIAGTEFTEIGVKHYSFDPSLAPAGKSSMVVMLRTHYGYWQHIYGHRLYDTEQIQVSDILIDLLESWYPGIKRQVEVIDVATPLSYERYTGNWQGSNTGWLLTRNTMRMLIRGMHKTLPNLKNFYMAGQWVEPGGSVPVVASSGRNAIQLICRSDRLPFVSNLPERI